MITLYHHPRTRSSRFIFLLEELDHLWIPVQKSWRLNERFYGALQGLNKDETIAKYGIDLVQKWRPERDNAQFYTDHFLLNVAWQQARHDELASLVRSLPKLVEGQ